MSAQKKPKSKRKPANRIAKATNISLQKDLKLFGVDFAETVGLESLSGLVRYILTALRFGIDPVPELMTAFNERRAVAALPTRSLDPKLHERAEAQRVSLQGAQENAPGAKPDTR